MSTDIRAWFEEIWEYCQEHWMMALAVGGVLLVLLVSAILILSARREDEEALWEDEEEAAAEPETAVREELPAKSAAPQVFPEPVVPEPAEGARGVVENLLKNVEEAGGAAGQKVESIQLKIEKAQLTIRYVGEGQVCERVETVNLERRPEEDVKPEPECGPAAEVLQEDRKEMPAAEKTEKKENEEFAAQPRKFGAENWNTARSGRVYTEEELYGQIID